MNYFDIYLPKQKIMDPDPEISSQHVLKRKLSNDEMEYRSNTLGNNKRVNLLFSPSGSTSIQAPMTLYPAPDLGPDLLPPEIPHNWVDFFGNTAMHDAVIKFRHGVLNSICSTNAIDPTIRNNEGLNSLHLAACIGNTIGTTILLQHFKDLVNVKSDDGHTALHLATLNHHKEVVQILLEIGNADINLKNDDNHSAIFVTVIAARKDLDCFQMLLSAGADLSCTDSNGNTILHEAVRSDSHMLSQLLNQCRHLIEAKRDDGFTALHLAVTLTSDSVTFTSPYHPVQILLTAGADPNCVNLKGNTPLHEAVARHNSVATRLLCEAENIDLMFCNKEGLTPLHIAASNGNLLAVILFIKKLFHFANLVNLKASDGSTALHLAAIKGHEEIVKVLTKSCKASVNVGNDKNQTALHLAVSQGPPSACVQILLSAGADPNSTDYEGNTALHEAVKKENYHFIEYLCGARGINFTFLNNDGCNPLHLAAIYGNSFAVKLILNQAGHLVNVKRYDGLSPLHLAACSGHGHVIETLIKFGQADINLRNNRNQTALHVAAIRELKDQPPYCVEQLLLGGADPNSVDCDGNTVLHVAVREDHYLVVKLLCKSNRVDFTLQNVRGFNVLHLAAFSGNDCATKRILKHAKHLVDVKKNDGFTSLHLAALNGHKKVVENLIELGEADINVTNNRNQTPLLLAVVQGHCEIIEFLIKKKVDINIKDNCGNTALHLILKNKSFFQGYIIEENNSNIFAIYESISYELQDRFAIAVACYLIKNGVDINSLNNKGQSALSFLEDTNLQNLLESYKPIECLVCSDLIDEKVRLEPCNHQPACEDCSSRMKKCLECGVVIQNRVTANGKVIATESKKSCLKKIKDLESKIVEIQEEQICGICLERKRNVLFLCGHGTCSDCAGSLKNCHLCRKMIANIIPIF